MYGLSNPFDNINISIGSIPNMDPKLLEAIQNALPKNLNLNLGNVLQGMNQISLNDLGNLVKIPKLDMGDLFTSLHSLDISDIPNVKTNFITNIAALTKDMPTLNIDVIANLTQLDIPLPKLKDLAKLPEFNNQDFVQNVKSIASTIAMLKQMAATKDLGALLQKLEDNIPFLQQAETLANNAQLPQEIRQPLINALKLVTNNLSQQVSAIKNYTKLSDLIKGVGDGIFAIFDGAHLPKDFRSYLLSMSQHIDDLINSQIPSGGPYGVTKGAALDPDENTFRQARIPKIKAALEKELGMKLQDNEVPIIAFCASGGGYRAMVGTRGFFVGAEQINLDKLTMYISCLSGGTWATWPFLLKKAAQVDYSAQDALNNLTETMFNPKQDPFLLKTALQNTQIATEMAANLFAKWRMREPLSFIDIYGSLVGNSLLYNLFTAKTFSQHLHDMQTFAKTGDAPLPIGTAVITNKALKEWLEVTPFTTGSQYLNAFIPTEAFGSPFSNCKTTKVIPSQFAGFFLGTFGSAFALNSAYILEEGGMKEKLLNTPVLGKLIKRLSLYPAAADIEQAVAAKRPLAAFVNNFTLKCPGTKLSSDTTLNLVDAGLDFNLPLPPLVDRTERQIDIIIIIDLSGGLHDAEKPAAELLKAINYFKARNIPFPVKESDLTKEIINKVSVFKNNKLTVIYVPWCIGVDAEASSCLDNWCNTFNFNYTPENIATLANCMKNRVVDAKDQIFKEIRDVVKRKQVKIASAA